MFYVKIFMMIPIHTPSAQKGHVKRLPWDLPKRSIKFFVKTSKDILFFRLSPADVKILEKKMNERALIWILFFY